MSVITAVIVVIGVQSFKTVQRIQEFVGHVQNELSFISTKAAVTLHDVSELLTHLKGETRSISEKSLLALHEVRDLISYIHTETQSLALKASNGIAKVTIGTLAIGALSQLFKKKTK
jgi:DNA integrity scanning protein DisA with diadenylate cyclase activity